MTRENRLFLGNPGTGKSTLINCLVGEPLLKSGISWGHGLTKAYHRVDYDDVAYMDTPGLADSSIAQESAVAITEALKQGGRYKLFFMMRLQNGRVVSEDVVTLERVLDAIQVEPSKIRFSVVFNMVDKAQYALLTKPGSSEFALVKRVVNGRRFKTDAFCFIPEMKALNEASDTITKLPDHVGDFMDQTARSMNINPSVVRPVDPRGFDQQAREVQEEMERLLKEKAVMMSALTSGEQSHQDASQRGGWNQRFQRGQNDAAASQSPPQDYIYSPQTPYLQQPHDDKPSSSILIRKKTLIMVAVAIVVIFAASITLVATLEGNKKTVNGGSGSDGNNGTGTDNTTSLPTTATTPGTTTALPPAPAASSAPTVQQRQPEFCVSPNKVGVEMRIRSIDSSIHDFLETLAVEAVNTGKSYFATQSNTTGPSVQVAFLVKAPEAADRVKDCSKDPSLWPVYNAANATTARY